VEAIVDARRRHGQLELLVKWLGYPEADCQWLPHGQLLEDCPDAVRAFAKAQPRWFH
jgi:hypothetical protein